MAKHFIHPVKVLIEAGNKQKAVWQLRWLMKDTRYTGPMLRKLRAERGIGNVRKIKQGI
jgi:hypothetical protein